MKKQPELLDYTRPETVIEHGDYVAFICDSFDGEIQNYNQEDFVW